MANREFQGQIEQWRAPWQEGLVKQVEKMLANKPYLSSKDVKNDVKLGLGDKLTNTDQE